MQPSLRTKALPVAAIATALTLLSFLTGFSQIKSEGLGWQEEHYLPRLEAVAAGNAPSPWQYRILTDRAVLAACRAAEALGLPRPVGLTFVAIRLLQNFALFTLAFLFYRRLGIGAYAALLGLSALAWGMTQANYGTDLAFNAYTDILLYLVAAHALLSRRYRWIIPLTMLAALNRETSGLIPVMAIACAHTIGAGGQRDRRAVRTAAIALSLYIVIFITLRLAYGARPWIGLDAGATETLGFLPYNLTNHHAWGHAAGVLGIIPLLAVLGYRHWHPQLRPLFWSVVPAWLVLHLFLAPLNESRVLLLPQVLVFIPGMLCAIQRVREEQSGDRNRVLA